MFQYQYMRAIVALVGVGAVVALSAYTYQTLKEARYLHTGPMTVNVTGEGEAVAIPDIATFSFSVIAEGEDAVEAQEQSAEAVNRIVAFLEGEGIEERDIKTLFYNLNPRYEFTRSICNEQGFCPPGERILRGYEVNQTVEVKVRETERAGELISGVGNLGATNVSGLQFTVDDEEAVKAEARKKAIENAKEKAETLAGDLGVRIVRMTNFFEQSGGPAPYGRGGDAVAEMAFDDEKAVAPDLPPGENTVTVRVSITYEVR